MTPKSNTLIGMMTATVLLFGGGTILFDTFKSANPDSTQYLIGGLLVFMAAFRIWRLFFDTRRARKRKQ